MPSILYMTTLEGLLNPISDQIERDKTDEQYEWAQLDKHWDELPMNPGNVELIDMAQHAFTLIALLSNKEPARVLADALQLHAAKNAGYTAGNEDPWLNFRLARKFGMTDVQGILVRLSDKYVRLQSLRAWPGYDQVGESLLDTLADFGAYCIIATCVTREGPVQ